MNYQTLISVEDLRPLLGSDDLLLVDCRFDLADPDFGSRAYREQHLQGARFADLNRDLSDLSRRELGRHPLPSLAQFRAVLSRLGFKAGQQVVVYDQAQSAYAARLWWMLRWIGHTRVAVLDGGFAAAQSAGLPMASGDPVVIPSELPELSAYDACQVDFAEVERARLDPARRLIDARGAPRFRGEVEPIDPVAGHIPGAVNRPFTDNLNVDNRFKSIAELRTGFAELLGDCEATSVIHQCGSGVTACHNLLAMEHAGLAGSRLFAPSWSGWIADPSRAVAKG